MKCIQCAREYDDAFDFCPYCGTRKTTAPTPPPTEPEPLVPTGPPSVPPPSAGRVPPVPPPPTGMKGRPEVRRPPGEVPILPPLGPTTHPPRKTPGRVRSWWQYQPRNRQYIWAGLVIAAIVVIAVVGAIIGTRTEKEESTGTERVTTTSDTSEEGPARDVDDLISIDNVFDNQEHAVGPLVIEGTLKEEGCSVTCNGQPVGVFPDTGKFAPTVEIKEGANTVTFSVTDREGEVYTRTLNVTGVLSPETYKAVSPPGPPFAELEKNPDAFAGTRCKYQGQVVQAMESMGTTDLRVDITPVGYGYWTDTIYVKFKGKTPAVKDNIVWVYGTITGSYSYVSQAGWNITLPCVEAKYVDVVR